LAPRLPTTAGWQCILDLYDCSTDHIDDIGWIESTLLRAAEVACATVVEHSFHRFEPHGISGVVVIAESHIAIHTWHERRYAAIDVFTCNSHLHVRAAMSFLTQQFEAADARSAFFTRGDHRLDVQPVITTPADLAA
jgi:S-adenosylmethionine decarboxylase proenzyme